MPGLLNLHHAFYDSAEYRDAIDKACKDASHDGNPADKYPNLPLDEFDGRFVAALLESGLGIRALNDAFEPGKPYPMMAPVPYSGGFVYPSYIVSLKKEHRSE